MTKLYCMLGQFIKSMKNIDVPEITFINARQMIIGGNYNLLGILMQREKKYCLSVKIKQTKITVICMVVLVY